MKNIPHPAILAFALITPLGAVNGQTLPDLTSSVTVLGNPMQGTNLSGRNRSVWDLQFFDNRIYLGSGNTTTNPGKNIVWSFSPATGEFTNELLANTEAIEHYRVIDGRLFLPSADPASGDATKFYYRDPGGSWVEHSHSNPLAHVRDMVKAADGSLFGVGNSRIAGREGILKFNSGTGYGGAAVDAIATDVAFQANTNFYSTFSYAGETFATSSYFFGIRTNYWRQSNNTFHELNALFRYRPESGKFVSDSTEGTVQSQIITTRDFVPFPPQPANGLYPEELVASIYRVDSSIEIGTSLVYTFRAYSLQTPQNGSPNYYQTLYNKSLGMCVKTSLKGAPAKVVFPGAPNAIGEDLLKINGKVYALANEKINNNSFVISVHRTATPGISSSWEPLFKFNTGGRCKSFEFSQNKFYFGMGADTGESTAEAGRLLVVPYEAVPYRSVSALSDITLTSRLLFEGGSGGQIAGFLAAVDSDEFDRHTFTIVSDPSSAFDISGPFLRTKAALDFRQANQHTIRIRVTDFGGASREKEFVIPIARRTRIDTGGYVSLGDDISSYATTQDVAGTATVSPDRKSVTITGNRWKKFPLPYDVKPGTVMEVTASGSDTGEIVGVGLENNNTNGDSPRLFNFAGSDTANGFIVSTPRYSAGAAPIRYVFLPGENYTGAALWLAIAVDDDANASANMTFTNFRIWEPGVTTSLYDKWKAARSWGSIPTNLRNPQDDPDGDGISNLLEMALGDNPSIPNVGDARLIQSTRNPNSSSTITLRYPKAEEALSYKLEVSPSLASGSWTSTGVSAPIFDAATETYSQSYVSPPGAARFFGRLRVNE